MTIKIAIVGEAWGEHEERARSPFVGPSGYELTRMLDEAGIARADCFLTNVFNLRPRNNDVETLCVGKKEDRSGLPPLRAGKYLDAQYLPEVNRCLSELRAVSPNITIALGNTAAWALLGTGGISKIRGTVTGSQSLGGRKVLPTYHPAAILRDWSLRHVTVLDLCKCAREAGYPEIRRPERTIYIDPSIADLEWFYDNYIRSATVLSVDIETMGDQITCIGFAPSVDIALVVPFFDARKTGNSFWQDRGDEVRAWTFVRDVLALPIPKVFQNGAYDLTFLWKQYGIATANCEDDTMLLHHALQPESEKGLAFLGSVYTNESSWKLLRQRGKTTIKRDE